MASAPAVAQDVVHGRVTSSADGTPMAGVTVQQQHTETGTLTDQSGNYSLSVSGSAPVVVFSYLGF